MAVSTAFHFNKLKKLKRRKNVARLLLVAAASLQIILMQISYFIFLSIMLDICDQFDVDLAQVAWINNIRIFTSFFAGVIITQVWRCLSHLMIYILSSLMLFCGVLFTYFTPSMSTIGFYMMFINLGVFPGWSFNLVSMTMMRQVFEKMPWEKKPSQVAQLVMWHCTIILVGISLGTNIMSQMLPVYLWRGSMLICATISLNLIPCGLCIRLLLRKCHSKTGEQSDSNHDNANASSVSFDVQKQNFLQDVAAHFKLIKKPKIFCYVMARTCISCGFHGSFFLLPRFYRDYVRFDSSQISKFLSIEAILCTTTTFLFVFLLGIFSIKQFHVFFIAFMMLTLVTSGSFLALKNTGDDAQSQRELRTKTHLITLITVVNGIGKASSNLFYSFGVSLVNHVYIVHVLNTSGIVTGVVLLGFGEILAQVYLSTKSFQITFGIMFVLNIVSLVFAGLAILFSKSQKKNVIINAK